MQNKPLQILSQLYSEYNCLMNERQEESHKEALSLQFKQKFISQFSEMEPTDMIRLCYEYFQGIIPDKKLFFDYNLLMFEVISSRLVRKPRILDVWFDANKEKQDKFLKVLRLAKKEILLCMIHLQNPGLLEAINELSAQNIIEIKVILNGSNRNLPLPKVGKVEIRFANCKEKFAVIDKRILINGCLEWEGNGKENGDKSMILIENESLARAFSQNFSTYWEDSEIIQAQQKASVGNNQNFLAFENLKRKNYRSIPLKKFQKIRNKFLKKAKKMKKMELKKQAQTKKIKKEEKKGGVFRGLFGFVSKIFR